MLMKIFLVGLVGGFTGAMLGVGAMASFIEERIDRFVKELHKK